MAAGIVDKYVELIVPRENGFECHLPADRIAYVQSDGGTAFRKFVHEGGGFVRSFVNCEPDEISGVFVDEITSDGLSEPAVGAGHEDDSHSWLESSKRAPMACSLQPTTLTYALSHVCRSRESTAMAHCQAEPAARPSPRFRFGEMSF